MGTIWAIHTGTKSYSFFLNGRTRLYDVFNKHKSKIDQIILKYTYILGFPTQGEIEISLF